MDIFISFPIYLSVQQSVASKNKQKKNHRITEVGKVLRDQVQSNFDLVNHSRALKRKKNKDKEKNPGQT